MSKKIVEDTRDSTHPYRVTAPTYELQVARFDNREDAEKYFRLVANMDHQVILSKLIGKRGRVKILDYSSRDKINGEE